MSYNQPYMHLLDPAQLAPKGKGGASAKAKTSAAAKTKTKTKAKTKSEAKAKAGEDEQEQALEALSSSTVASAGGAGAGAGAGAGVELSSSSASASSKLTPFQRREYQIQAAKRANVEAGAGAYVFRKGAFTAEISGLRWPWHCIDFETSTPPLPHFRGMKPYEVGRRVEYSRGE